MVPTRVEKDVASLHEPFTWFPPSASLCGGGEYKGEGHLFDYWLTFAPRRDGSNTTEAAHWVQKCVTGSHNGSRVRSPHLPFQLAASGYRGFTRPGARADGH